MASDHLHVKIAFDAKKTNGIQINKLVTGDSPEEFIKNLLSGLSFEYVYKYNQFLIVEKRVVIAQDTAFCHLLGIITDRESGEQLPFATVSIPELGLNACASSSGSFSFKNIHKNPFRIVISFIGYIPVDTFIAWKQGNIYGKFELKRKVQMIDTVVVNSPRLEMIDFRKDVDFATTINTAKLGDLPVLAETDIFRTLQLLPGISYSESSSELSIHGGSSDQNLILFDGQTLYNLSHYYGMISSLNPNVIKDVQVFKGGYDSRYGERVSGIVDITGKSGNLVKPKVYGDLNLVSGNITAELPLTSKLSVVAAYRRSYSDIYATELADNLVASKVVNFSKDSGSTASVTAPSFRFYDYNVKVSYRISDKENLSVSAYGGKDFFSNSYVQLSHGFVVDNTDRNAWSNYGVSVGWSRQWNASLFTNLLVGTSGYSNIYNNTTSIKKEGNGANANIPADMPSSFEIYDKNTLSDFSVSLKNSYTVTNNHLLYFGAVVRKNGIYYHKDAGSSYIYDNIDQSNWVSGVYFLDKIGFGKVLTFKPGIRLNYYDGTGKFYLEPRAALGVAISSDLSLRFAYGRYCQFISQVGSQQETGYIKNFWVLADGSLHPVLTSNHYVLGTDFKFGDFLFDFEAYYKQLDGIQEYFYVSQFRKGTDLDRFFPPKKPKPATDYYNQPSFFIYGDGRAFGVDFLVRYKRKYFTSWLSYAISRSLHQFDAVNWGREMPSSTDQLHQLSFTNMVALGKWNLGAITFFSTGRPYFESSVNQYDGSVVRTYSRLPDYFRLDLSANYSFGIGNARFKIGSSIINVLNTENYFDQNTREINYETTSFSQTNLIRSRARSLNLFLHFSF
jgi:hypothetical protein